MMWWYVGANAAAEIGVQVPRQTLLFLMSLGLGAGLSLLYDVLRLLRLGLRHHDAVVFAEDVCYWFVWGMSAQWFFQTTDDGYFRWYLIGGIGLGMILCHFTLGALIVAAGTEIFLLLEHIGAWIREKISVPVKEGIGKTVKKTVDCVNKQGKKLCNSKKNRKNRESCGKNL